MELIPKQLILENMKKITLKSAYEILNSAKAVIIDDDVLCYPSIDSVIGVDENEFMALRWTTGYDEYLMTFAEGDNQEIKIGKDYLLLFDTDGGDDPTKITLLANMEIAHVSEPFIKS